MSYYVQYMGRSRQWGLSNCYDFFFLQYCGHAETQTIKLGSFSSPTLWPSSIELCFGVDLDLYVHISCVSPLYSLFHDLLWIVFLCSYGKFFFKLSANQLLNWIHGIGLWWYRWMSPAHNVLIFFQCFYQELYLISCVWNCLVK